MTTEKSINQEKQQKINRTLVLRLVRQEKLASRAEIAKLSGLQRATITNIVKELIELGIVVEDGLLSGDKGRRSIGIRINGEKFCVAGVMVTREYFGVSLIGLSGEIRDTRYFKMEETDSVSESIRRITTEIHGMIEAHKQEFQTLAVGVAGPGPYKMDGDEVVFVTNLVGWDGSPISSLLQADFNIPVYIENDANAGAFAQLWNYEKSLSRKDMAYIVAGQGIGCGIISNGVLLKGALGIAGEIGHTTIDYCGPRCECGNYGCLEMYCSLLVFKKNIRTRLAKGEESCVREEYEKKGFLTQSMLKNAMEKGDSLVKEEFDKMCEYLAVGIINVINQLNPELVIIGDSLAEIGGEYMLTKIKRKIQERVRPIIWDNLQIELNEIPENPILVGAAAIAAQRVFENPAEFIK